MIFCIKILTIVYHAAIISAEKFIRCHTKRTEVSRLCPTGFGVPTEERGAARNTSRLHGDVL